MGQNFGLRRQCFGNALFAVQRHRRVKLIVNKFHSILEFGLFFGLTRAFSRKNGRRKMKINQEIFS